MSSPYLDRVKGRDTGHHGRKAEKKAAVRLRGKLTPGSGALDGAKGDILVERDSLDFLVENKATLKDSFSLRLGHLHKIYQEALEQSKTPALAFQFVYPDGGSTKRDRWVAIPEHIFEELTERS